MKYTKEQLQAMSDFEVNKALAIAQSKYAGAVGDWMPNGVKVSDETGFFYSEVDYCNTPNDIMPLAFEHGVDYKKLPSTGKFAADYAYDVTTHFIDAKPLRAIACCLILALQEL